MAIRFDSWRSNFIFRAPLALLQDPIDSVLAPHLTDRSDAVSHPEFVNVLSGNAGDGTDMRMCVDKAGKHVHAGEIHFPISGHDFYRCPGTSSGGLDRGNTVLFDDNVHRPNRRSSRTVNQSNVAQGQMRIGPFAFGAGRRFLHGLLRVFVLALALARSCNHGGRSKKSPYKQGSGKSQLHDWNGSKSNAARLVAALQS